MEVKTATADQATQARRQHARLRCGLVVVVLTTAGCFSTATAQRTGNESAASAPAAQWASVPRLNGRLRASDIGLVINSNDP